MSVKALFGLEPWADAIVFAVALEWFVSVSRKEGHRVYATLPKPSAFDFCQLNSEL